MGNHTGAGRGATRARAILSTAAVTLGVAALAMLGDGDRPARADEVALPAYPEVVYVAQTVRRDATELGVVPRFSASARRVVVDHQGEADRLEVAFGPGGRWAALVAADGLAGQTAKHAADTATLVFGDLDAGITKVVAGDQKCIAVKCFEGRPRFSADGKSVYTEVMRVGGSVLDRYGFGKAGAKVAYDKHRQVKTLEGPQVSRDGKSIAYVVVNAALYVEPLVTKRKPRPIAAAYVVDFLYAGDRVFFTRREPTTQETYRVDVLDVKTRTSQPLYTMSHGAAWPPAGLLHDAATDRLYVVDNDGDSLIAIDVATATGTTLATHVRRLLDLSDDGSWLLAVGYTAPIDKDHAPDTDRNPARLALIDTRDGAIQWLAVPDHPYLVTGAFRR